MKRIPFYSYSILNTQLITGTFVYILQYTSIGYSEISTNLNVHLSVYEARIVRMKCEPNFKFG